MRQIEKKSTGKQLVRRSRVWVHDACKRGKQTRMAKCWVDVGEEGDAGAGKLSPVMSSATLRNLSSMVGVKRNHSMTPLSSPISISVCHTEWVCMCAHARASLYCSSRPQACCVTRVALNSSCHGLSLCHHVWLTKWLFSRMFTDSLCISERWLGSVFQSGVDWERTNRKIYPTPNNLGMAEIGLEY